MVPAEYSSGERTRRGSITKAGSEPVRTALAGAAWSYRFYRFRPAVGVTLRRRQHDAALDTLARSWQAQRRLYALQDNDRPRQRSLGRDSLRRDSARQGSLGRSL
jgi:transposase